MQVAPPFFKDGISGLFRGLNLVFAGRHITLGQHGGHEDCSLML